MEVSSNRDTPQSSNFMGFSMKYNLYNKPSILGTPNFGNPPFIDDQGSSGEAAEGSLGESPISTSNVH